MGGGDAWLDWKKIEKGSVPAKMGWCHTPDPAPAGRTWRATYARSRYMEILVNKRLTSSWVDKCHRDTQDNQRLSYCLMSRLNKP